MTEDDYGMYRNPPMQEHPPIKVRRTPPMVSSIPVDEETYDRHRKQELDHIQEWLQTEVHATLWGRSFDTIGDDTTESAAIWFQDQMESYRNWRWRAGHGG
jgi:hypothetical protein